MSRDHSIYVDHMLEAIANIELDTAGYDFEKFRRDRRVRQLVERNLEIISEASRRLPQEAKDAEGQIPWRAMQASATLSDTTITILTRPCSGKPAPRTCSP